jgi:transposase InsO family protein
MIAWPSGPTRLGCRPARRSDHARRDEALRPEILRVLDDSWRVYGVRKVWRQLRREGFDVARGTVARLMQDMVFTASFGAERTERRSPTRRLRVRWTR